MGYFSKCCAKTHLPVVVQALGIPHLNNVVALLPDGTKLAGSYDGYGRVAGKSLMGDDYDHALWQKTKFVLRDYYEGETYKELGKSNDERAQGYFMDKAFLHYCIKHGPFRSHAEYVRAFKKYANW